MLQSHRGPQPFPRAQAGWQLCCGDIGVHRNAWPPASVGPPAASKVNTHAAYESEQACVLSLFSLARSRKQHQKHSCLQDVPAPDWTLCLCVPLCAQVCACTAPRTQTLDRDRS